MTSRTAPAPPSTRLDRRPALVTGLLYLALAASGAPAFLLVRPMIFDAADPAATLANLEAHAALAGIGLTLQVTLVATQALAALWFFRLFRGTDPFQAAMLATFGMVNAVMILVGTAALWLARDVALTTGAAAVDRVATVQSAYLVNDSIWEAASLFFGLWLLPMGVLALRSGMPRPLGWLLLAGGTGYVVGTMLTAWSPTAADIGAAVKNVATVGELWMVGYLIWYGLRTPR